MNFHRLFFFIENRTSDRPSGGFLKKREAFTLIELLVVIAIIVILASLLLTSLSQSKGKALTIKAVSNMKQLEIGWRLYTLDNDLKLPASGRWYEFASHPDRPQRPHIAPDWTGGQWLDLPHIDEQAELDPFAPFNSISSSPLWPYCGGSPGIWRDPRDRSRGSHLDFRNGDPHPRVRSFAINSWVGGPPWPGSAATGPWAFYSSSHQMDVLGPSHIFVFMAERPDSINDGYFVVDMAGFDRNEPGGSPENRMVDFPGSYHNQMGTMVFGDGHAEYHRWKDARTMPPLDLKQHLQLNIPSPENPDLYWLQKHSSYHEGR